VAFALLPAGLHHPGRDRTWAKSVLCPLRGSADRLLFQLLGVETTLQFCGGDFLQPCRGRRTAASQLGCNIPSPPSHSWRGRLRGSAEAFWGRRWTEVASLPTRLPTSSVALGLRPLAWMVAPHPRGVALRMPVFSFITAFGA
jgi:hypothetical protein